MDKEYSKAAKLVQVSLAKASQALSQGNEEEAEKLYRSTDQLCDRVDAPPPVQALVVRLFTDLLRKQATSETYSEARSLMSKAVEKCEASEYKKGIPKEIQTDLRARMADVLAAWGEMEREAGCFEASVEILKKAVDAFRRMGNAYEYMAATQNRLAVSLIELGDGEAALTALKRAEQLAESVPQHQDQLMQQTWCHRGSAYARLERDEEAVSAFHTALDMAHATGNAALAEEIETRLELLSQKAAAGEAAPAAAAAAATDDPAKYV